jgi:hypothetical protein
MTIRSQASSISSSSARRPEKCQYDRRVFESATWTVQNRRNFEIIEHVYARLGLPLMTEGWDLSDDDEYAGALVHLAGVQLFYGTVSAANWRTGRRYGVSSRKLRATWKEVNPERGARASVFLTLGTCAMLSPGVNDEVPADVTAHARRRVIQAFSPPETDVAAIDRLQADVAERLARDWVREAVERGGLADVMTRNTAQTILSFEALKIAGADPASTLMYAEVADVDPDHWFDNASYEWMMRQDIGMLPRHWETARATVLEITTLRPD